MLRHRLIFVLLACSVLAAAGCGSSSDSTATAGGGGATTANAGALTHVEGTLAVDGKNLVVTPESGAKVTLATGPEVAASEAQALAASGVKVRAFYHEGEDPPVAAKLEKAPLAPEGSQSVTGTVLDIQPDSITLATDSGDRAFEIRPKDRAAFDVDHLKEHAKERELIRVYYAGTGDAAHALAYEDA